MFQMSLSVSGTILHTSVIHPWSSPRWVNVMLLTFSVLWKHAFTASKAVTSYFFSTLTTFKHLPGLSSSVSSVQFSRSVVSDTLRPHESQHTRPPCPSPTPGVHSDSRPSSQWCHPAISALCRPLLLLPPISPSIRVFSSESTLRMRHTATVIHFCIVSNGFCTPMTVLSSWNRDGMVCTA